jgi:hypothetical protein
MNYVDEWLPSFQFQLPSSWLAFGFGLDLDLVLDDLSRQF